MIDVLGTSLNKLRKLKTKKVIRVFFGNTNGILKMTIWHNKIHFFKNSNGIEYMG